MSSEEAGKAQLEGVVKQIGVLDAENEKKKQIEEKLALLKKELEIATIERQLSGMDKIEKEMAAQKENLQKVMVAQKAEADKLALSLHTLHSSHPKLVAPNIVARADQYLPMASTGVKAFSSGQNMQLLDLIVKLNQPLCALGPAKSGNLELRQKPVLDISAWDIKEAKRLWINEHTREDSSTSDTETTISSMNGHSISAGLNAGLSVPGTVGGSLGLKFDKSTTNSNSNSQQRSTTSLRLFRSKVVVVSEVDFQRKQFSKEAYAEAKGINSVESAQKFINTFGAWIPSGKWKLGGSYTIIHTATSTADRLSEKDISEIKTSYGGEVSAQKGPVSGGGSGSIGTTDVTSGSNVKASSNYTIETTSRARGISNFNPTQDQIQALYDYNMTWEVVEALDVLDEECIPVSDIAFWEGLGTAAHYLKEAISKIDLKKKVEPAPLTNKQKLESHQAFSTWLRNVGTGKYLYHKTTWDSKANRPDGDYLNQTGCQDKWNFVPCAGSSTEYNLQYDATKQYLSIDGSRARTRAWNESEERFTLFVDGVVENLVRIRIKSRSFPRYLTANTNGNDIEIPELSDSRAKGDDTAVWLIPLN